MPVINQQTWQTSESVPPEIDFTGAVAVYSAFGQTAGWQNGNPLAVGLNSGNLASTASAPFPMNWAAVDSGDDFFDTPAWIDQSGNGNDTIPGGAASPRIITATERLTYDGTQFLEIPSSIFGGSGAIADKCTIYQLFNANTVALLQTLLQSGYTANYVTDARALFANYIAVTGSIVASQKDADGITFNSKTVALPNTGLHLVTTKYDRAVAGAGATILKLDNSTTGVSNVATGTMTGDFSANSVGIGMGQPLGAAVLLDGSCNELFIFPSIKDDAFDLTVYNRLQYLYPSLA